MTDLPQTTPATNLTRLAIPAGLTAWFLAILWLGQSGAFATEGNDLPFRLVIATATPPVLFYLAWSSLPGVRAWVSALDLVWVTAAQGWRVVGAAFLFLWALGDLPLTFAAPAGIGDIAVGITAAGVTVAVARQAAGWRSASWWLIGLGMLDFAAAFATAILSDTSRVLAFPGAPTGDLLQVLPMVMIPAFAVPIFIILHLIAAIKLLETR